MPDAAAAPSGNFLPSVAVVGAVEVYVPLRTPTAVPGSELFGVAVVADEPGVPAVDRRQRSSVTAVVVVLNTSICRMRMYAPVPPTSAQIGSVVDPAVVVTVA